uniref:Late embryogenesis abundant protein LEA-2 subgroup domain-containing protein n=1 Tax=Oryza barthii TaxID=65489 RepID=A0A0D3G0P6_9ORYZ
MSSQPPTATAGFIAGGRIRRPLPRERPHLTRCTKLLCSWFLSLLLVAGVLLFVVYLVVRPHRPRFHVAAFTAAGVQSGGGPVALSGQLTIHNPNHDLAFFFGRVRSRIRVRVAFWGSHWHPVHATCDVVVGPDGQLLPEFQQKRCGIDFF